MVLRVRGARAAAAGAEGGAAEPPLLRRTLSGKEKGFWAKGVAEEGKPVPVNLPKLRLPRYKSAGAENC